MELLNDNQLSAILTGSADKGDKAVQQYLPFVSTVAAGYTSGGNPLTLRPGETTGGTDTATPILPMGTWLPFAGDVAAEQRIGSTYGYKGALLSAPSGRLTEKAYKLLPTDYPETATTISSGSANQVRVMRFTLDAPLRVTSVRFEVTTGSGGTLASIGIYSASGNNLLVNSGAVDCTTSGVKSVTLGSAVNLLAPAYYIFAFVTTDTALLLRACAMSTSLNTFLNDTVQRGTAANAATAGALPATLGTITSGSFAMALAILQGT